MAREDRVLQKLLHDLTNPLYNPASFAAEVKNLHPKQQQTIMRTVVSMVDALAHDYTLGYYDARNADVLRAAWLMSEAIKAEAIEIPYL